MAGTKLLPCPFCGGEATFHTYNTTCSVDCQECRIGTYHVTLDDYKSAINAWNTRAERTCHDYNASAREHGAYLFMWRCSNCGESYDTEMDKLNYCPNCGAKVVNA